MIEPINKITCDWCGKFELMATDKIPKEFFLLTLKNASGEKEEVHDLETLEPEKVLICTACRNSIQSVKKLRMKERRENNRSQFPNLDWSIRLERQYSDRDRLSA